MEPNRGPFPTPAIMRQLSANVMPPLQDPVSGEIRVNLSHRVLGAAQMPGRVTDVWMSVRATGKDDSNALGFSGEVYINGVSCLSTIPSIGAISGESSQQKTTRITGDTDIVQAVLDNTANSFSAGDVFTWSLTLKRTATPTTEINSPVMVVVLEPSAH